MTYSRHFPFHPLGSLCLLAVALTACVSATVAPPIPTATPPATLTPEPTSTSTATLVPSSTPIRTPPALPGVFQTTFLNPVDTPHTYIQDSCQYLQDKWSSANSTPGTVAMVIMIHSIVSDDMLPNANQITEKTFHELIGGLMGAAFEAVTTSQLADFLEHNAKIPEHSVLLVVDDRHYIQYFDTFFRPLWEADGWPVVNAFISASRDNVDATIWKDQEVLNAEGWVDYQAHGVVHNTPMWPGVSDEYIMNELQGSIDAFKLHFNKTPIAIIWPGGGFSSRSVEIARQLDYRLGFTTSARGPLMFNWVPLGDTLTDVHGEWQPEGPLNDPLMLLPRYWDTDALRRISDVVQMGQAAAGYAGQNKATDLEYYDIVCAPQYGPIP
jgi:hypothetical protein